MVTLAQNEKRSFNDDLLQFKGSIVSEKLFNALYSREVHEIPPSELKSLTLQASSNLTEKIEKVSLKLLQQRVATDCVDNLNDSGFFFKTFCEKDQIDTYPLYQALQKVEKVKSVFLSYLSDEIYLKAKNDKSQNIVEMQSYLNSQRLDKLKKIMPLLQLIGDLHVTILLANSAIYPEEIWMVTDASTKYVNIAKKIMHVYAKLEASNYSVDLEVQELDLDEEKLEENKPFYKSIKYRLVTYFASRELDGPDFELRRFSRESDFALFYECFQQRKILMDQNVKSHAYFSALEELEADASSDSDDVTIGQYKRSMEHLQHAVAFKNTFLDCAIL